MTVPAASVLQPLALEVPVAELGRALAFYQGLGFTLRRADETFAIVVWAGLHEVFLFHVPGHTAPATAGHGPNLRIIVPDVDGFLEKARTLGGTVIRPAADRSYGLRDGIVLDLDGFELRPAAPLPARP